MKTLWLVLFVNGVSEAYTPVGNISMKACEAYAAKQMMLTPTNMMTKVDYRCVMR